MYPLNPSKHQVFLPHGLFVSWHRGASLGKPLAPKRKEKMNVQNFPNGRKNGFLCPLGGGGDKPSCWVRREEGRREGKGKRREKGRGRKRKGRGKKGN